jgi:hypothetical protein
MNMNRRLLIGLVAVLIFGIWLYRWCQPERQVRRAQGRWLAAAESGDIDSFAEMMAADYRDGWGHDKTFVVKAARQVFPNFQILSIDRTEVSLEMAGEQAVLTEKMSMRGLGGPIAMAVRERANQLKQPFTMKWRKHGWKPWDWELTSIEQPEITAGEMDVSW